MIEFQPCGIRIGKGTGSILRGAGGAKGLFSDLLFHEPLNDCT
jgi:hypothetical protein